MDIPNQDKNIYNIVEKKDVNNTVVENLLPKPETPKLPDIVPKISDVNENADNLDQIVDEVSSNKASELAEKTAPAAVDAPTASNSNVPAKPADLLADNLADNIKTKPAAIEKAPAPLIKEEKTAAAAVPADAGGWQIQLIASKNKAAVEKTWVDLSSKYADLKKMPHEVQASDLGAQGMFYRLRAGSFADKAAAVQACNDLKAKGLRDCIAKEK